jgi:hypothetical protein
MIVLFLMVTLMLACAVMPVKTTQKVWSKPNFTQQEFAKDKYECIQQAQQTKYQAQGATGYGILYEPGQASSEVVTNQNLFILCMEARGWSWILQEKPVSDNFTGRTTYTYTNGKYEGDFVNGKPHGRGIFYLANGDKYEGDWINSEKQGRGIYYYADGDKYEGDFVKGKFTGRGTFTCSNGKQFTGNFENDKPIGFTVNCAEAKEPTKPAIQNSVIPTNNSSSIQPTSEQSNKSENLYSQKLRDLKKLKDEGLLTDKEYEQKRKAIVDAM